MKRNVKLRFGGSVSLPSGKWALRLIPVLGLLFSASTLRAEDNTGGVKFNPGVRYSQWAINSRSTSFNANTTQCGMATITNGSVSKGSFGKSSLDYVPGLVAKSMIEAADYYQDFDWSTPWFKSVEEYGNKYYSKVPNTGGSLDDLNAVKLYIGLYNNKNASEIYKKNYKTAISRAQAGLVEHNNANSIQPGTLAEKAGNSVEGGWFHKNIYNNQMWLDGAYMGSALLAQIINFNGTSSNIFGSSDNDWNMVAKQMNIVWNMCWNSNDKLLYHAFEANAGMGTSNSNAETWAGLSGTEPYVFHSQSYWGRANAWYLMALVDVLEAMNNAGQNNTANYTTLKQHLADLAAGIAARQDATTGGWYQVMDKKADYSANNYNGKNVTAVSNYIETSATAIFSAAYFKAVRLGLLDSTTQYDYKTIAKNAFEGLVNNFVNTDNGDFQIWGSCRSAGLGGENDNNKAGGTKFRDGSNAYYLLGYDVPMVKKTENITEGKVLGGFIMAATEYERAYQNQESKQILFAKDLAPTYTINSSADVIDATAYGTDAEKATYQWYKVDGTAAVAVANATSATFSPTESGSYYCTATVGNNKIKTSTTTVTVKAATEGGDETPKADEGTVTFSGDDLKKYSSSMTDATKTVTIATTTGTISGESGGDIKVAKKAAFSISVPEGKYIKSITYALKSSSNGELTFDPAGTKTTSSDALTYTYNYSDNTLKSVTATNSANMGGIQVTSIKVTYASVSSNPTTKKYTVTATAGGGGTVAIKDGSNDVVTSGTDVEENTSLTFTATANDGYEFVNWTDGNGTEVSAANPYTTTVSAAINIKANFKKKEVAGGETTTKTGTFSLEDLKILDSNPTSTEKSEITLNTGYVTIKAGKAINADDATNDGMKISKSSKSSFSIVANNGANIKSITIEQNTGKYKLSYDPAGTESNAGTNTFKYDYPNSSSSSMPSTITVSYNASNNVYVKSITVEYETAVEIVKTDLTASFSPATIEATEGDASVDVPTLAVTAGGKEFTDYKAITEYTTTDANVAKVENGKVVFVGKGTTTISVNVTPNNTTLYNGCKAEFTVNVKEKVTPVEPTEPTTVYDFKTNFGSAKSSNTAIEVNTDNIVFGANYKPAEGKYITITPKEGGFKAGDLITITGKSTKGNALMTLNSKLDSETSEQYQFNALGTTETTYQYLLQADCPVLYLGRASGSTATITGLTVTRAAAAGNKTRLVATFPSNSITVVNTTPTVELPKLTVKDGDTELTNEQYTVVKKSDNPAVATISGNEITIKSIGTATIFATITPTEQTKYEGCIATYQVTVKEPTPLSISTMDVTINTVDAEVKQPIIKVYGDNDKLLTFGTDYTLSYEVDNTNVKVDNAGVFSVTGSAYNWTAGTSKVTVTATPTTTLGNTYTTGSLTFEYNVVKGKITPVFHESFNGATIRVKTDAKKNKTLSVPLIYDGEDVSEYFDYTYTINDKTPAEINTNNSVDENVLTFRPATAGSYTIKVSAAPKKGMKDDGSDNYTDVYNEPAGITFTVVVGDNFIRPTVTVDPSSMTMYTGTREEAADVTVMNGKDIIPDDGYKLAWRSFTPGIVKVDANGNIEAVSEGNGDIRVSVYGENLETMTATIKVYVDDPALYRAKLKDNKNVDVKYGNQRVMWNQNKTMSVTLGGWMFPSDVTTNSNITTEGLKSSYAWDEKASLAKWKLTGFDHFVMSNSSKNARQENGSNVRPESTTISSRDFKTYKETIKDQMFNVPCSGSFLEFNPATNGMVNVHVFQNGVFDASGKDIVYSPQRRVFVMDEAGNFVSSSAQIESTTGKPTGGLKTIDQYKWDLNPNGANTAPTIEMVRSHFKNMPETFDMTTDGFKNNVYESNLSTDIVPNDAATKNPNRKGVTGWSVLADSPVTYSFHVKAGKTYYLYNFGSKIGFYGYSFEEDENAPVVDNIEYKEEADNNQVTSTSDGHVAKVSINRTFKAGVWSTCVLPFSLNKQQVDAIFGETYSATAKNGTEILYFDRVDENGKVWFVRHAYNTIVANKPFLIKPTKDVNGINTADCTEYPYVIIEAPESGKPAAWCEGSGYSWVSGYSNNEMMVGNGDGFIAKDGSFMTYTGSPAPLKGFRGYLKKDSGAQAKILSVGVGSNVDSDNTTTLIDNLIIDNDANASYGISDGKVYNINGQVVGNGKSFNTLPSGVYIINGKKYIK